MTTGCYCSIIDGRNFLCEGCAKELHEQIATLKDLQLAKEQTVQIVEKQLEECEQSLAEQHRLKEEMQHERDEYYAELEEANKKITRLQNTIDVLTKGREAKLS